MSWHRKMTATDGGVHTIIAYEYADAAGRTGATGFTAEDVGKIAHQANNDSIWRLTAITPTWAEIASVVSSFTEVPFNHLTTTLILSTITIGQLLKSSQVSILATFGAGTTVQLGTYADPGMFLNLGGADVIQVGAYNAPEFFPILVNDSLLLTVSAVGITGTGKLFYEVN